LPSSKYYVVYIHASSKSRSKSSFFFEISFSFVFWCFYNIKFLTVLPAMIEFQNKTLLIQLIISHELYIVETSENKRKRNLKKERRLTSWFRWCMYVNYIIFWTWQRLFEICFHFAGHRSSTQELSAGPSEFLPDLHFLYKIALMPSNVIPLLLF
jgi:hypothetical protein